MSEVTIIVIWIFLSGWFVIHLLKRMNLYIGNEQMIVRLLIFDGLGIPAALVFVCYALLYPSGESVISGGNSINVVIGAVIILLLSCWLLYHSYHHKSPRSLVYIVTASTVITSFFGYLANVLVTLLLRFF